MGETGVRGVCVSRVRCGCNQCVSRPNDEVDEVDEGVRGVRANQMHDM